MKKVVLSTAIFSSFTLVAQADENRIKALEEQIKILQQEIQELKQSSKKTEELSKETEIIKEEIRNLKLEVAIPELELKSFYGLGPAASKAYFNPKGLSIGGYGELTFVHNDVNARGGAKNIADVERFILYIGYSFSEKIKFNSELELEHASTSGSHGTGGGYFKAEFAALDFLLNEKFNIRSGLVLMPVGIINEVHEPPTFPSAQRPFFERRILMSTWEEMGIGAYGKVGPLEYKAYLINGLMLKGGGDYSSVEPLKNVRQRGARAVADRFGFTGRVDYNLPNNLKIGASLVHADIQSKGGSDSNLNLRRGSKLGTLTIISPHIWWQYKGWDVRFVGAFVKVDDALKVSQDLFKISDIGTKGQIIPQEQKGFYTQVAYDIFRFFNIHNQELYLFGIYEDINTHSKVPNGYKKPDGHKLQIYNIGFSYKPHPLVAIKADYVRLNYSPNRKDENEYRLTFGFMF